MNARLPKTLALASLSVFVLFATPALAQDAGDDAGEVDAGDLDAGDLDAGELPDAGEPDSGTVETDAGSDAGEVPNEILDASVGEGGNDRDQQEGQDSTGRAATVCRQTIECERGFECLEQRCVYTGAKQAGGGCFGGTPAAAFVFALGAAFGALRRRRP